MQNFIKFFGSFIPQSALDSFEFTTSQQERDDAQARSLAAFELIEQGGGFNTFAKSN